MVVKDGTPPEGKRKKKTQITTKLRMAFRLQSMINFDLLKKLMKWNQLKKKTIKFNLE